MLTTEAGELAHSRPGSARHFRRRLTTVILVASLPVFFLLSLLVGSVDLSVRDIFAALWFGSGNPQHDLIVTAIRLPRTLLAALIGAVLAICGAASQGLFRNPLADPSLIGVTAGSAAGASLVIVLGGTLLSGAWGLWWISLGAFLGGIATVGLVYRLATGPFGTSVASMLLAGIAITALAGSFTSLLSYLASNDLLRRISLWQMGGLDGANYARVLAALTVALVVFVAMPRFSNALNALLLGESEARHLGFDVASVQRWLIVLIAAGVGSSVALAGTISFVGLVVPHMVRLAIGADHRYLLPLSAIAGAVLLVMADAVARSVMAPAELPVGLVTALVGAPFFISLLRHRREYGMQP